MLSFHQSFKLNGNRFSSEEDLLKYTKEVLPLVYLFLKDWFSSDGFITVQTSGSTGTPKQFKIRKEYMRNSARATGDFFNVLENTTALLCLSSEYIAGKMMLVRALTLGWNLDVVAPTSEVKILKEYDFSAMVPLQLRKTISRIHKIKKLIVGGGVVENDVLEQIKNIKTAIFATYGMTETITHIAVKSLNNLDTISNFYQVLPNITIYKDQRDCLLIKAEKLTDEFIITNDVVQLISDTQFQWLGRFDNVINSGGIKLHPEKIEEKLSKIITQRFFVAGIKDSVLGEKLILIIEGDKQKNVLKNIGGLSKYEHPKEIYFIDSFIETETKKIQRNKNLAILFPKQ